MLGFFLVLLNIYSNVFVVIILELIINVMTFLVIIVKHLKLDGIMGT